MGKIKYGDFQTLAEILDISVDAAKKRYKRNDPGAVEKMELIIENRKMLIQKHKEAVN